VTTLARAQRDYDRALTHALRARTDVEVRERFDAADRAMTRLQREGRAS
jgi:hypothetical protein